MKSLDQKLKGKVKLTILFVLNLIRDSQTQKDEREKKSFDGQLSLHSQKRDFFTFQSKKIISIHFIFRNFE